MSVRKVVPALVACITLAGTASVASAAPGGNQKSDAGTVSSIELIVPATERSTGSLHIGDVVTYATTIETLKGYEWPMVTTSCYADDGTILWSQLDYPDVQFPLAGTWTPWYENGGDGTCEATLWAYSSKGGRYTARQLAATPTFTVSP